MSKTFEVGGVKYQAKYVEVESYSGWELPEAVFIATKEDGSTFKSKRPHCGSCLADFEDGYDHVDCCCIHDTELKGKDKA